MNFKVGASIVGFAVFGYLVYLLLCLTVISPGYVGVVYDRTGGLEKETLKPGWHIVSPMKKVTKYPVSTETVHYDGKQAFSIATKDGKVVTAELMYSFHMNDDKIPALFAKFRGRSASDIETTFIKDRLTATVQTITSNYGVLEVYGDKRGEINNKVFLAFKEDLAEVGIVIETFNFSKIEPDAETRIAIQSLVDSQLRLETMRIEKEQAMVEADRKREVAKGEADARVIEATGQAEANQKLQLSLTPELIEYESIKKWNGQYPQVVGGNQMIQLPITGGK